MTRKHLFIGISSAALAIGLSVPAVAQTVVDSRGNTSTINCPTGNVCTVNNSEATNGNNDNNAASITVTGTGNNEVINQNGDLNSATITVNGNNNSGFINQVGDRHRAALTQNGASQRSTIDQNDEGNSATVTQTATAGVAGGGTRLGGTVVNTSYVLQGQTDAFLAGTPPFTTSAESFGEDNIASVSQNGSNLDSRVIQTSNPGLYTDAPGPVTGLGASAPADDNNATVTQTGTGSRSTILQSSRGNTALVNMGGGGNSTNSTGASARNNSQITQGNTAFRGSSTGAFTAATPDQSVAFGNPLSGNQADVAVFGVQNSSSVFQNGVQNRVVVDMLGGGRGNTSDPTANTLDPTTGGVTPAFRPEGNSSTISQTGRGNYAAVSIGGLGGAGNISRIIQNQPSAGVTSSRPTQADIDAATLGGGAITESQAHRALVYQRGTLDEVTITQSNNSLGGTTGTTQSGSVADVSQKAFRGIVLINQVGSNTAIVSQGNQREVTGSNNITVNQTDAGDQIAGATFSTGGTFGGGSTGPATSTPQRNYAEFSQSGVLNTMTLNQNAVNARSSMFQALGSRNNTVRVEQGTGGAIATGPAPGNTAVGNTFANANNLTATTQQFGNAGVGTQTGANVAAAGMARGIEIVQNGQNLTATASQAGGVGGAGAGVGTASNNAIAISQVNANSSATVTQSGTNLSALVDQRATLATADFRSTVYIEQTGDNNAALARQTETSGASTSSAPQAGIPGNAAFPNSRSAGIAKAEIEILQSGSGNSATVEQRGRGQFARIDQRGGTNNVGGILQGPNATNAVAILEQSGTSNTFFITQFEAGQYLRAQQTGTGNANIVITERSNTVGGTGGLTSTAAQPALP